MKRNKKVEDIRVLSVDGKVFKLSRLNLYEIRESMWQLSDSERDFLKGWLFVGPERYRYLDLGD